MKELLSQVGTLLYVVDMVDGYGVQVLVEG